MFLFSPKIFQFFWKNQRILNCFNAHVSLSFTLLTFVLPIFLKPIPDPYYFSHIILTGIHNMYCMAIFQKFPKIQLASKWYKDMVRQGAEIGIKPQLSAANHKDMKGVPYKVIPTVKGGPSVPEEQPRPQARPESERPLKPCQECGFVTCYLSTHMVCVHKQEKFVCTKKACPVPLDQRGIREQRLVRRCPIEGCRYIGESLDKHLQM